VNPVHSEEITALDRCDRCGARARIRAVFATGGELLFCAHHGREHRTALAVLAVVVEDQSDRLEPASAIT